MLSGTAVIVDPYSSGEALAPALKEAGFGVVAVTTTPEPPAIYASSYYPEDFDTRLTYDDLDALVDRLRGSDPVLVIPGAEPGVELADWLAAHLTPHLANDPALTSARRHKGDMVRAVAAAGLPTIRTLCTADETEIDTWLTANDLVGRDLVLKPPKCGGTDGVTLAPGGRGRHEIFRSLLGATNSYGFRNEQVVVQEYVRGVEYFVDTFSFSGRHTVDVIGRYRKIHNGDHMAVYESAEFVAYSPEEHGPVVEYVKDVLEALGIRFGPAHTEVMLTADGPRLIECGARLAGGGTPSVSKLATGGRNVVTRLVSYLTGGSDIPDDYEFTRSVMTAFLVVPRAGTIRNVELYEEVRELPSFLDMRCDARNGDLVAPSADLPGSLRYGLVLFSHEDAEQVQADRAALREIESRLVID
ncbi:Dapdiamide A synthase [Actinosynnema sp. ALI-1.44]